MVSREIQEKIEALEALLTRYDRNLGEFEQELFAAIRAYSAALKEERLKELKEVI